MRGPEEQEASEAIALELENLKAGMDWSQEVGEDRWVGAYGLAFGEFFDVRGLWAEGRERLLMTEEALRRAGNEQGMVQALKRRATYCWMQGDYAEAQRLFVEGLGIAQGGGDRGGMASCLKESAGSHPPLLKTPHSGKTFRAYASAIWLRQSLARSTKRIR